MEPLTQYPDPESASISNAAAAADGPSDAEIARESAAIYPDTSDDSPTPEEIAREAYRIYMNRGASHGHDMDDWFEAERRLVKRP